jgi:hypothetical protein
MVTCHLYKWLRWNLPIKNKMGTRTLLSRRGLHPRLQAIKLLASLTQSTQNFVSPHPIVMRPSSHQRPTWHQSPRGRQAQVVVVPEVLTATARGRQSFPPSPQAWHPVSPRGSQGGRSRGYGYPPPHEQCRATYRCSSIHARRHSGNGKSPVARGPTLKVVINHYGGWHSHASSSQSPMR